jgi:hypothetical protein
MSPPSEKVPLVFAFATAFPFVLIKDSMRSMRQRIVNLERHFFGEARIKLRRDAETSTGMTLLSLAA